MVKLKDFIPTIALLCTGIDNVPNTLCFLLMFTFTLSYLLQWLYQRNVIPIIALAYMDINIVAYTICLLLLFTLAMLY